MIRHPMLQRAVVSSLPEATPETETTVATETSLAASTAPPTPQTCPPPADLTCPTPGNQPDSVAHTFQFAQGSALLSAGQKATIDGVAAAWNTAMPAQRMRIDGYASAEGDCAFNWGLSCRRAQAVIAELDHPSDGSPGVSAGQTEHFAHGESDAAGSTLAPNRRATLALPSTPPPPPTPPQPTCRLPVQLGRARGCGSHADFRHFDRPAISAQSAAVMAAWATLHHPMGLPLRSGVSTARCMLEMDGVLVGLAGAAGHAAFRRFAVGTGGTETHRNASTLGSMAVACASFLRTVGLVQSAIETQLAAQAPSGALNPCALAVTPPATHFSFSDGVALKAVIGGTQGEELLATHFTGDPALRTYSIGLRFLICDDFGVDESDLYAPGLIPFWILQHERSASAFAPFINQLDLNLTISGMF